MRVLALLSVILVVLITGCSPDNASTTDSPSDQATGPAQLNALLDRIHDAVQQHRRDDFRAQLSARDPGFPHTAEMIFENLAALQPTELELAGTGRTIDLVADRSELLGPGAYAAEITVDWAVSTDPAPSRQQLWLTVRPESDRLMWAGVSDGPASLRRTPLWWLESVRVHRAGPVAVIAGNQVDTGEWTAAAARAAATVGTRLTAAGDQPAAGWNGRLTVIVPSNSRLLERMLGAEPGTHAGLAAISRVDGPRASTAPIRIIINPAADLTSNGREIVLAHEAVHVATRSPLSPAPTWLVEGFADLIAYTGRPAAERAAAAQPVLDQVRASGPPQTLPGEDDFATSGEDLSRAYAAAWLLCRYLDQQYGRPAMIDFYAEVDDSTTGEIGPAAREAFGITADKLLTDWQDYLNDLAER